MTSKTTTKEALEPCPKCNDCWTLQVQEQEPPLLAKTVTCGRCGFRAPFDTWQARVSAPIAPVVDDEQVTPSMVIEALRMMVELWDANNPDDPCGCVGASDDCKHPPPCELCCAREALRSIAIERPRQVFDAGFPAPASPAGPSRCVYCDHYGNVVNGRCQEVGTVVVQGGEAGTICDCECVIPATTPPSTLAKAAAGEIVSAFPEIKEHDKWVTLGRVKIDRETETETLSRERPRLSFP